MYYQVLETHLSAWGLFDFQGKSKEQIMYRNIYLIKRAIFLLLEVELATFTHDSQPSCVIVHLGGVVFFWGKKTKYI